MGYWTNNPYYKIGEDGWVFEDKAGIIQGPFSSKEKAEEAIKECNEIYDTTKIKTLIDLAEQVGQKLIEQKFIEKQGNLDKIRFGKYKKGQKGKGNIY